MGFSAITPETGTDLDKTRNMRNGSGVSYKIVGEIAPRSNKRRLNIEIHEIHKMNEIHLPN